MRNVLTLSVLAAFGIVCLSACSATNKRPSAATTKKETPPTMTVQEDVKPLPDTKDESPFACNML